MNKRYGIIIGLFIIFILTLSFTSAYATCDGGYSPYPTKCIGGSPYQNQTSSVEGTNGILILIGIMFVIWLIVKRRR